MLRVLTACIALLLPLSGYAHNHAGEPTALPEKAMAFAQMAPLTISLQGSARFAGFGVNWRC